jgi:hypothetical protein
MMKTKKQTKTRKAKGGGGGERTKARGDEEDPEEFEVLLESLS